MGTIERKKIKKELEEIEKSFDNFYEEQNEVCPKCGSLEINTTYIEPFMFTDWMKKVLKPKGNFAEEHLTKACKCGYVWREDCNDKKEKQ